ncbi:hypothetical protein SAMD00023353_8400220 [Rosellinia necatrix]|uniref:Uncharacterized protein n=1 Tax=Rosellinia necatrix TaxID=77044 RepID=A0A1S8AB05_ROSNE|nr:hypothetical protein SAMD00023353_8400220 [Rosellinia necatrix]
MIRAEPQSPGSCPKPPFYFDYAMFRAKVAAAKSGPTLPALGVPPRRTSRPAHTGLNVRGAGWHKRGYRDHGMMWINVRQGSYGHTSGTDAPETGTLTKFIRSVFFAVLQRPSLELWHVQLNQASNSSLTSGLEARKQSTPFYRR